ncbi:MULTISPECIES: O-methyltransferase [unclassified Modicisalibacter]|uniref:O-methyltransferase n=1 Tax=unclassified Modicisalibacter TaxID=2679913 RepID=UPI001CCB7C4B|nr:MULTISPECIES: O-methyltransferase [unclassified Modicisalibacter]MBZ9559969.1 O-methyltransferase [Modicisalibacter sp. R2A 31.J]MBZ9575878.1 O-methyltransferase [Modicisalibacter sp. MOD 31.J]
MNLDELLAELEELGDRHDATAETKARKYLNITRETGEFLTVLIKAGAVRHILEVGTSNGYSTLWLAAALPDGGHVTTLEISPDKADQARDNFQRAGLAHRITLVREDASRYLERAAGPFDLIFLDADRASYRGLAETIVALVRPGGLLVCDNALSHADEMRAFIDYINDSGAFTTTTVPVGKGEFVACKDA